MTFDFIRGVMSFYELLDLACTVPQIQIMKLRYDFAGERIPDTSFVEIGKRLGISRSRVHQLEEGALIAINRYRRKDAKCKAKLLRAECASDGTSAMS